MLGYDGRRLGAVGPRPLGFHEQSGRTEGQILWRTLSRGKRGADEASYHIPFVFPNRQRLRGTEGNYRNLALTDMIKNERQYRITKAKFREFSEAIADIESGADEGGCSTELLALHRAALKSQADDLESELAEYESLRDGEVTTLEADSLSELPRALIKARIARGLTHKDLADRLAVKEQQVQRWESTDYAGVSIETLRDTMAALGVLSREELYIPDERLTVAGFLKRLTAAGIPKDLLKRIAPPALFESSTAAVKSAMDSMFRASSAISRIFGAKIADLLSTKNEQLLLPLIPTHFKLPARAKQAAVDAYTLYAHYLACIAESVAVSGNQPTVSDWHEFFKATTSSGQPMSLRSALKFCWNSGIIVVPLRDPGTFHGAVWKIRERFVIVLKQTAQLEALWLFDLLHEVAHIAKGHVTTDVALIEAEEISLSLTDGVEAEANEWAENALFDGESEQIEEACVNACGKDIRRLKGVVPTIANEFNVNVGALANHMAFRLNQEQQSWWATARALQSGSSSPFEVTREIFLKHMQLNRLNPFDRDLLIKAITDD